MTQLMQTRVVIRWVLITAAVLAVPALAMALKLGVPDPGQGNEDVNWGPMDFAIIGVLVLGAGLLFESASSHGGGTAHRAAVGNDVAMFATATTNAVIAVIGHVAGLGPTLLADAFWVVAWVASALLFRQASLTSAAST